MGAGEIDDLCTWHWYDIADVNEPDSCHMTVDAQLFEQVGQGIQPATIRCYTWQKPSVSIGRLQCEESVREEFLGLPLYRRPTGGKAVEHGDDLTICVASRIDLIAAAAAGSKLIDLYRAIVEPVRLALASFGTHTSFGAPGTMKDAHSEDCFSTTALCDVVDRHGIKMLGSAMRRSSRAVIVQMSLRPTAEVDITGDEFAAELRRSYKRIIQSGR